jgi:hypothetical protein
VVHYDEDGHRWLAGRLVDAGEVRWLIVGMERSGSASMRWMQDETNVDLAGYPPESIQLSDRRYVLEKRGTATARIEGEAGLLAANTNPGVSGIQPVSRCRWWRYEAAGGDCLVVEQWGSDYRALRGVAVTEAALEMIPGS